MNVFANAFRCAGEHERGEVLIDFLQETPDYDDTHQIVGIKTEVVSSVIMSKDSAAALIDSLNYAITPPTPDS